MAALRPALASAKEEASALLLNTASEIGSTRVAARSPIRMGVEGATRELAAAEESVLASHLSAARQVASHAHTPPMAPGTTSHLLASTPAPVPGASSTLLTSASHAHIDPSQSRILTTLASDVLATSRTGGTHVNANAAATELDAGFQSLQEVREVISNAIQTGLEEQIDKAVEIVPGVGNVPGPGVTAV